jgi:rhodanese-related sulfurtransferase
MRKLLFLSLLACSVPAGCSRGGDSTATSERTAQVATVSVDELDRMLANHECRAVDANGDATRKKLGVIPGAVLLGDLDSLDNLPADRTTHLVFYCANTACGASHAAARKAITAGYTRVQVLPEGIAGWVKAGKKTASL